MGYLRRYVNFVRISSTKAFMSELTEIVDSLENKISKLLYKYENLKQKNHSLQEELTNLQVENQNLKKDQEVSEKHIQTLKAANALLGSNEHKKETKLKINGLIREIDQCIVQLSE